MCVLAFAYDDAVEIYLARDVPALKHQRHLVLAQATLASIDTNAEADDAGSLPVEAASLYVAPLGATSTGAAGQCLADIPLKSGTNHVDLTAAAQNALSAFLVDFNTPFVLILSGHVAIGGSGHVAIGSATLPPTVLTVAVVGEVNASF